jgi:hypothetical protein
VTGLAGWDGATDVRIGAARVTVPRNRTRPRRLVFVDDPEHGVVRVWLNNDRRQRWRCSSCGNSAAPACWHTYAAAAAVGLLLAELRSQASRSSQSEHR